MQGCCVPSLCFHAQAVGDGGGGLYVTYGYGSLTIAASTFSRNSALRTGGGARTVNCRAVTLSGVNATSNTALLTQVLTWWS